APRRAPAPAPAPVVQDSGPDPWDRSARASDSNPMGDPDEVVREAKELFRMLGGGDKVAFWSAAVVLLSCFFPWKETAADGDVLGLMSLGAVSFVLCIVVMTAISMRVRESLPGVNPVVPWMAQLVSSIVCLVWCIIYVKVSSDTTKVPTPIGNSEMMNSTPSFGVFMALLGSVAMLGGTLLGLKSKSNA
ncbi:hypothetical protein ACLESO_56775, partial [Pyxidicoccus sp. 3LG]